MQLLKLFGELFAVGRLRDHPCVRGEHERLSYPVIIDVGSPLRTRGARKNGRYLVKTAGITPAYAGSTKGDYCKMDGLRDHPCVRGEHRRPKRAPSDTAGSPLRTRGAHERVYRRDRRAGITPAYAGSTRLRTGRSAWSWDHPCVRGEHVSLCLAGTIMLGSPLRTRGALAEPLEPYPLLGITPAYAGSTTGPSSWGSASRDHPCVRGEHGDPFPA